MPTEAINTHDPVVVTDCGELRREALRKSILAEGANASVMAMTEAMNDDTLRAFHATVCHRNSKGYAASRRAAQ
jgi:hypothetical protein